MINLALQAKQMELLRTQVSTSNLNLRSLRTFKLLWSSLLFFTVFLLPCTNALASNWSIAPELGITTHEDTRLHIRTPNIRNAEDSQIIITAIALRHPFISLSMQRTGDRFLVQGTGGNPIAQINFKLAPLALVTSLRSITTPYVGQIHSQQLLDKIIAEVKNSLNKRGYLNADIKFDILQTSDGIEYTLKLDIGEPCIVKGYKWDQAPPIQIDQSLKVGDICSLEDAAKTIAETEIKARQKGYANANLTFDKFQFDTNKLNFAWVKVKGDFGKKVTYEFIDQKTGRNLSNIFSNSDLASFDPAILGPDSVSFELIRQLKTRGYTNAQVSNSTTHDSAAGELVYTFSVLLGESMTISRLQIEGNTFLTETEIFNMLGIERPSQSESQNTNVIFNPDAIAAGIERVRTHYINNGFWDAKIQDRQIQSEVKGSNTAKIIVLISIEEGQQRIFDRLAISGNTTLDSSEIEELVDFTKGEPLDRRKIVDLQQKIRSAYASNGYFYTTAASETSSRILSNDQMETTVIFKIEEGPRVRFGDIFITGLVRTEPKVVLRELYFDTGDWYDPDLVTSSTKALLKIGAFSRVTILPLDPDLTFKRSELVDLVIQVVESPSRTVTFGPGWSSYYGMRYNVEGALTNIGGTGRQLFGRASFNEEVSQKAIGSSTLVGRSLSSGYIEPHLLDTSLDGTVSLSQAARATEYAWSLTKSGEFELSHTVRSIGPGSKIAGFYNRKLNDEESTQTNTDAFLSDTFSVGRVGTRFLIDKRNDVIWPSDGFTLGTELSWARYNLGGDLKYFKWEVSNNHYFSPFENFVFAIGLTYTSFEDIERIGQENADILPASERLNSGGADTIRGFREASLGPIVRRPSITSKGQWDCNFTSSPTGGTRRLVAKLESRYRFSQSIAGTIFIDTGTTSFSQEEKQKFTDAFESGASVPNGNQCKGNPKRSIEANNGYELTDAVSNPKIIWERNFTSTGAAVNFLTPIGAINVAYGVPWREPKDAHCEADPNYCYPRSDTTLPLWRRGEVQINVGAKF